MCPELKPDRTPQKATKKKKKKMVNTLGSRETRKLKSGKPFILLILNKARQMLPNLWLNPLAVQWNLSFHGSLKAVPWIVSNWIHIPLSWILARPALSYVECNLYPLQQQYSISPVELLLWETHVTCAPYSNSI